MADQTTNLKVLISAQNQTQAAFNQFNNNLNDLKTKIVGIASLLAGGLAFGDIINSTREWGRQVDMLQDQLGGTAEEMSALNFVAQSVGITTDELSTTLGVMNRKIVESAQEISEGTSIFDKWNIKLMDANGNIAIGTNALSIISKRFQEVGQTSESTAHAMEIFGRSGKTLSDFLALSDSEIKAMIEDGKQLGLILSQAGLESLDQFNRAVYRLNLAMTAIKLQIGQALIPVLSAAMTWFRNNAGAIKSFGEALGQLLAPLKAVIERIGQFFADVKSFGLNQALQNLIKDIIAEAKKILPMIGEELDKLGPIGWAIKIAFLGLVAEKIGLTALLGALIAAMPVGTGLAVGFAVGGAALQLTLFAGLALVLSVLGDQFGPPGLGSAIEAALVPLIAIKGIGLALAAGAAGGPWILAITAGVVLGVTLDAVLDQGFKDSIMKTFTDPVYWAGLFGIGAVAVLAVVLGAGGIALSLAGILTIAWTLSNVFGENKLSKTDINTAINQEYSPNDLTRNISGNGQRADAAGNPDQPNCGPGYSAVKWIDGTWRCMPLSGGGNRQMASGGIVTSPMHALIGEAGPEAVIPLDRSGMMGTTIVVNVSGNIARSEEELAERISDVMLRKLWSQRNLSY